MKNKHSYMQQVGAVLHAMNYMNTYMGRLATDDREFMEVLRNMRG